MKRYKRIALWMAMVQIVTGACGGAVDTTTVSETESMAVELETIEETLLYGTEKETLWEETLGETETEKETESFVPAEPRHPSGHRIVYEDGKIFGQSRYEYDENGRRTMVIFLSPRGDEYWSPDCYDGNGHLIPEAIGDWSVRDEKGLYLQVGTEDSRGRRTVTSEYEYDDRGNLTDYWYMFVKGKAQRHTVYTYDEQDRILRIEVYNQNTQRRERAEIYTYNQGQLLYKAEMENPDRQGVTVYTYYRYDTEGRLSREELLKGGEVSDYIQYTYNEVGELISEYHYLEDPMMGKSYTVEYIYEELEEAAG